MNTTASSSSALNIVGYSKKKIVRMKDASERAPNTKKGGTLWRMASKSNTTRNSHGTTSKYAETYPARKINANVDTARNMVGKTCSVPDKLTKKTKWLPLSAGHCTPCGDDNGRRRRQGIKV